MLQTELRSSSPRDSRPEVKIRSSCDACLNTKVKCSQTKPLCERCIQHGRQCVYSPCRKIGRPSAKAIGASTLTTDQQQRLQRTSGDTGRTSKKGRQQQIPQSPAQTQQQHEKQPLRPQDVPGDAVYAGVNAGNHLGILAAQSSSNEKRSGLEDLDADNSAYRAEDPVLSLDQNMTEPELAANTLDYGMEGVDWSALECLFDAPAPLAPMANQELAFSTHGQYHGSQPRLGDIMAGHVSPASWDSQEAPTTPSSTQRIERIVSSRPGYPFFAGNSFVMKALPPKTPDRPTLSSVSSFSSRTAFSRSRESNLFSVSSSRCTFQCYADLTNQLADIGEFQVKVSDVALDVLLNLDDQVRKARHKIFRCPFCLATPGCAQTLMLITMVVANLLNLFEHSCGSSDVDGVAGIDEGSRAASSAPPTSKNSPCGSRLHNPLPYTTRHLTVGDIQLDETVKLAFSRRLVRMYLDRQVGVVQQLNQLLSRAERENVSFTVTQELLKDVLRRLEHFIGFITLTDSLEIRAFY